MFTTLISRCLSCPCTGVMVNGVAPCEVASTTCASDASNDDRCINVVVATARSRSSRALGSGKAFVEVACELKSLIYNFKPQVGRSSDAPSQSRWRLHQVRASVALEN
jgi:hypothetical protein